MSDSRRIDDPELLKGIAQPIRQKLWRLLLQRGPCTVGTLAEALGADPGQVSYHLRELANRGWVDHAPELARDRRESWWRATPESTNWSAEDFHTPEGRAVVRHLSKQMLAENLHQLSRYLHSHERWSPPWRAAANTSQSFLYLTAEQAQQMNAELNDILRRWGEQSAQNRERDGGEEARPYFHFMYGFPETTQQEHRQ